MNIKRDIRISSIIIVFLASLFLQNVIGQSIPARPVPPRLVNDFSKILSQKENKSLEKKLVRFNDTTSNQITVVIINSLGDLTPSMFATEIGLQWKVGQQKFDNGIVVLVKPKLNASDKGHAYIAVGYGLEPAIPDAIAKRIVDNEMLPYLRQGDYYGAINKATTQIETKYGAEYVTVRKYKTNKAAWLSYHAALGRELTSRPCFLLHR